MLSSKIKFIGGSLATLVAGGAMLLTSATAEAAMAPSSSGQYATPDIQLAWCALGAHIGPVGACIGGGRGWGPGTGAIAGTIDGAAGSATDGDGD